MFIDFGVKIQNYTSATFLNLWLFWLQSYLFYMWLFWLLRLLFCSCGYFGYKYKGYFLYLGIFWLRWLLILFYVAIWLLWLLWLIRLLFEYAAILATFWICGYFGYFLHNWWLLWPLYLNTILTIFHFEKQNLLLVIAFNSRFSSVFFGKWLHLNKMRDVENNCGFPRWLLP